MLKTAHGRYIVCSICVLSLIGIARTSEGSRENGSDGELLEFAAAGDGQARLKLSKRYLAASAGELNTSEAAKWLRRIVADGQEDYILDAFSMLQEMKQALRQEFPDVSDEEFDEAHGSVGVALSRRGDRERALPTLIREAWLLSASAQKWLELVYEYPFEGYNRYEPDILKFYRACSAEGVPRPLLFMGKILLWGWGVPQDVEQGRLMLEECGMGEAYMNLAAFEYKQGNEKQSSMFWRKAAEFDIPDAYYNLAITAQENRQYAEAVRLLKRTLELDSKNYAALLELGRMYVEGWGVPVDFDLGFKMLKQAADEGKGREAAVAAYNVGMFYAKDRSGENFDEEARYYLEQALEGGVEQAKQLLDAP